jgi:hypothetical protein
VYLFDSFQVNAQFFNKKSNLKMSKILVVFFAGSIMFLVNVCVGWVFQFFVPQIKVEYENHNLFRAFNDPLMSLMILHPFIVALILAWIWNLVKTVLPTDKLIVKGLFFGLIYWLVSLPGMLISYGTFPISIILVLNWSVGILLQSLSCGIVFSRFLK